MTLESATMRGMYVGMTTDGQVRPSVDVGDKSIRLYPEVVECEHEYTLFISMCMQYKLRSDHASIV